MTGVHVALALATALDLVAVRRLHDFGDLDDAGVTHAYEQMRMQRFGHLRLPSHLARIVKVAAVIDEDGAVRVLESDREDSEAALLDLLDARLPSVVDVLAIWNAADVQLLSARAFMQDRRISPVLANGQVFALGARLGYRSGALESDHIDEEAAVMALANLPDVEALQAGRISALAHNRYRLWLRWQVSQGVMNRAGREARERALLCAAAAEAA